MGTTKTRLGLPAAMLLGLAACSGQGAPDAAQTGAMHGASQLPRAPEPNPDGTPDPGTGLAKMAREVTRALMSHLWNDLGFSAEPRKLERLADAYLATAQVLLTRYSHEAIFNGLESVAAERLLPAEAERLPRRPEPVVAAAGVQPPLPAVPRPQPAQVAEAVAGFRLSPQLPAPS